MSKTRRIKRQQERESSQHMGQLVELLGRFYTFLEKTPKPTDEEVRNKFIESDKIWKAYCSKNHLTDNASLLFNQEVAMSWKKRYAKQETALQNQTQESLQ